MKERQILRAKLLLFHVFRLFAGGLVAASLAIFVWAIGLALTFSTTPSTVPPTPLPLLPAAAAPTATDSIAAAAAATAKAVALNAAAIAALTAAALSKSARATPRLASPFTPTPAAAAALASFYVVLWLPPVSSSLVGILPQLLVSSQCSLASCLLLSFALVAAAGVWIMSASTWHMGRREVVDDHSSSFDEIARLRGYVYCPGAASGLVVGKAAAVGASGVRQGPIAAAAAGGGQKEDRGGGETKWVAGMTPGAGAAAAQKQEHCWLEEKELQ